MATYTIVGNTVTGIQRPSGATTTFNGGQVSDGQRTWTYITGPGTRTVKDPTGATYRTVVINDQFKKISSVTDAQGRRTRAGPSPTVRPAR